LLLLLFIIIIIVVVVVVVVMLIQVNLGQTCLQEPSNMRQKIIYKKNINNL
jgi:preprotein translocase subunit SecG